MPSEYTRLTVNIHPKTAAEIRNNAAHEGISQTEVIRRAVALYDLVQAELAEGRVVQVRDGDGNVRDVVLLF